MVFVGFGFLMVSLKNHGWTSIGYNFVISALVVQLTILLVGFWHQALLEDEWKLITVDLPSLIIGDFGALTVMITYGAILGKCSMIQLWIIAVIEVVFFGFNEALCAGKLGAVDMGGAMYVHTFGAYFGVAASFFFENKRAIQDRQRRCGVDYYSGLLGMIGSLFLWMYWPSATSALAPEQSKHRVIINTVLALTGSCISACAISRLALQRLDMVILLNATMAGGVSIGTSVDLVTSPSLAILIGALGGLVCAASILYLTPFLRSYSSMHDTGGAHDLHGLPGILGGLIGAICTANADSIFKHEESMYITFPKLAEGRTISEQAWI